MKFLTGLLCAVISLNQALPAHGASLAYVEWSSAKDTDQQKQAYMAFDDQKKTAWCSGPNAVGDQLVAGFLDKQVVDEIGFIVGAVDKKGALDKSRARIQELRVSDGLTQQLLQFKDKADLQFVHINPALNSRRITFSIEKVFFGARRSSPVCISSIILRKSGRTLNAAKTATTIRLLKKNNLSLLHLWIDAPGAPERYLTFSLDGRFSWIFAPILEGKPAKIKGHWSRKGDTLYLSPNRGKSASLKMSLGRVADGDQVFQQLLIEGKAPHPSLAATYQTGGKE